jgi:PAS domain S-box-containing protein
MKNYQKNILLAIIQSILIILFLCPENNFAISKIDSLEVRLLNTEAEEKLNTLLELSKAHSGLSHEKEYQYADEALRLSYEIKNKQETIKASVRLYDINISDENYKEAIDNCETLIKTSKELEDKVLLCNSLDKKAYALALSGNYSDALKFYNESYELRVEQNDLNGLGKSYINYGSMYEYLGDSKTALSYFEQALGKFEECNKNEDKISTLIKMGSISLKYQKPEEAIKYLNSAKKLAEEKSDNYSVAVCEKFIGKSLIKSGDFDNAEKALDKALNYFSKINSTSDVAELNKYKGNLYLKKRSFNKAKEQLEIAIRLFDEKRDYRGRAKSEKKMGILLKEKGELVNARQYFFKCLDYFNKSKDFDNEAEICELLTDIYLKEKNYNNANKYFLRYISLKNNISETTKLQINQLRIIDKEMVKLENSRLLNSKNKEIDIIENKEQSEQLVFYTALILTVIMAVISTFLFVRIRKKSKVLEELSQRLKELEEKYELSAKELQEKVNEKIIAEQYSKTLDNVVSNVNESVIITDSEKRIIFVNDHFKEFTGFTEAEVLKQIPYFFSDEKLSNEIIPLIESGYKWKGTLTSKKKDGSSLHESATIIPVLNSDGKTQQYVIIQRDISESLLTNEVVEKSEAILNAALINSQNSIVLIGPGFEILLFNPNASNTCTKLFDTELKENLPVTNYIPAKDRKSFTEKFEKCMLGESINCQRMIRGTNDQDHLLRIKLNPVETVDKKVIAVLMSILN